MIVQRRGAPTREPVQQRLALRRGIRQPRLGAPLLLARRLIVVEYRAAHLAYSLAFVRQHRVQVAARASPMGQAVTPDQRRCIGHGMARQRGRQGQRFFQTRLPCVEPLLEVCARLAAACVIQPGGGLAPLHRPGRGVPPGAFLGR
jgi:hypothetical protein